MTEYGVVGLTQNMLGSSIGRVTELAKQRSLNPRRQSMEKVIGDFATKVKLSPEEAEDICRLGQLEKCCAFLVVAPGGFECIRMSYPANGSIFKRLKEGTMNAKGEGEWKGCAWEEKTQ